MDTAGLTVTLLSLCGKLYNYAQSVKNASKDVEELSAELAALQPTLESARSVFGKEQSTVLQKLNKDIAKCLEDLESKLCGSSRGLRGEFIGLWRRFNWPLKESETREYILQIHRLQTSLVIEMQTVEAQRQIAERDQQQVEREKQESERKKQELQRVQEEHRRRVDKREKVLEWVYAGNCNERHIHIRSQRKEGTGLWLFDTPQFHQWIERQSSPVLLGCGIPGAGKTFLSSVVIDRLLDQQQHDGVGYIYFGYQDQLHQKPVDIMSIIMKQLLSQLPELPSNIESLYDELKADRPKHETIKSFLFSMASCFAPDGRVFIVCDALDEMDEHEQRQELLPLFHEMKDVGFEIFLTSRPHPADVRISFTDAIQLDLIPDEIDLKRYVRERLIGNVVTKRLIDNSETLNMENVVSALVTSAEGMFLLAELNVTYICKQVTAYNISTELKAIMTSSRCGDQLDRVYDRTMETIRSAPKPTTELALRVLSWLSNGMRALSIEELRIAVSIEECQYYLDRERLPPAEKLADICAGFVIVENDTNIVRLAHYTTQEYLKRRSVVPQHLQGGYHTRICATYLAFDEFKTGLCESRAAFCDRIEQNAFLNYAAGNLSRHVRSSDQSSTACAVARFIKQPGNLSSYFQAWKCSHGMRSFPEFWECYQQGWHPIHAASELGHEPVARSLVDIDGANVSAIERKGKTPLYLAARSGHEAVVRILIARGANVSLRTRKGKTPLHTAAQYGHPTVAQLLINQGADVSATSRSGRTPLHFAAVSGFEVVARILIDGGADVSLRTRENETPLHVALGSQYEAIGSGHVAVARLLINAAADISAIDSGGNTPLHLAAWQGCEAVARMLIDRGADTVAADQYGMTALDVANKLGHETVVRLLIDGGATYGQSGPTAEAP